MACLEACTGVQFFSPTFSPASILQASDIPAIELLCFPQQPLLLLLLCLFTKLFLLWPPYFFSLPTKIFIILPEPTQAISPSDLSPQSPRPAPSELLYSSHSPNTPNFFPSSPSFHWILMVTPVPCKHVCAHMCMWGGYTHTHNRDSTFHCFYPVHLVQSGPE